MAGWHDVSPTRRALVYTSNVVVLLGALFLVSAGEYWIAALVFAYALGCIGILAFVSRRHSDASAEQ